MSHDDIDIEPIGSGAALDSEELRARVRVCGNLPTVRKYIARRGAEELGLLCTDQLGEDFWIYEIYVLRKHRDKGLGNRLLECGERLAQASPCVRVCGKPSPLDGAELERLVAWYERRGYRRAENGRWVKPIERSGRAAR